MDSLAANYPMVSPLHDLLLHKYTINIENIEIQNDPMVRPLYGSFLHK